MACRRLWAAVLGVAAGLAPPQHAPEAWCGHVVQRVQHALDVAVAAPPLPPVAVQPPAVMQYSELHEKPAQLLATLEARLLFVLRFASSSETLRCVSVV